MKTTGIKIVSLLGLVVLFGYWRDTLFVRIEWYEQVVNNGAEPPMPYPLFDFLSHLTYGQLVTTRYLFTALFIGIFYGLSWLMVKWFFYSRENIRLLRIVFLSLLGAGLLLFALGWITGSHGDFYQASRYVIGVIETPLCLILLFPLLWVSRKMAQ